MTNSKTSPAIAALLSKVKPATSAVKMCLAGDILAERDLVRDELSGLSDWTPPDMETPDPRVQLQAKLAELEEAMRENTATFHFQSVGEKAWSDLLAEHPPREGKDEAFDPTTFAAALISASASDPKMSLEDANQLLDLFNQDQRNTIFGAAYSANIRGVDIPFSQGSFGLGAVTEKK